MPTLALMLSKLRNLLRHNILEAQGCVKPVYANKSGHSARLCRVVNGVLGLFKTL